jgi:hypothetical protein
MTLGEIILPLIVGLILGVVSREIWPPKRRGERDEVRPLPSGTTVVNEVLPHVPVFRP